MAFPTSPTNGQTANVNGVTYVYSTTIGAWTVSSMFNEGVTANVIAANVVNVVGNITGGNLLTGGLISATGNITGGNLLTGGLISATGNITGGNLLGTIRTDAQPNITSVGTLTSLSVTGNITGGNLLGTIRTDAQPNITSVGTLTSLSVTGNITVGNVATAGLIAATGNITGGNVATAGLITADGNITSTTNLIGFVRPSAGTVTAAPVLLTTGTNLTTPAAGAVEFDGSVLYATEATAPGRGEVGVFQQYRYTAAGTAKGPAIADYFPATSSINLAAGSIYEIEAWLYFLKTTAGTATFTWAFSSAVEVAHSIYEGTAIAGFNTTAVTTAPVTGQVVQRTSTTLAHAATGSLTTAVYHSYRFRLRVDTNLATTARLRITNSAGTSTPQPGSYYSVRQISADTGNFAA